jgi:hypothetical protein
LIGALVVTSALSCGGSGASSTTSTDASGAATAGGGSTASADPACAELHQATVFFDKAAGRAQAVGGAEYAEAAATLERMPAMVRRTRAYRSSDKVTKDYIEILKDAAKVLRYGEPEVTASEVHKVKETVDLIGGTQLKTICPT